MTKKQSFLFILATTAILAITSLGGLHAQMIMQVDPKLQATGGPLMVKQKGVKTIPNYYFDGYNVVSSKAGWLTTNSIGNGAGQLSSSSQVLSFAMVNDAGDTAIVNMEKNGLSQSLSTFFGITMSQGSQNVVNTISASNDSLKWDMAVTLASGVFNGTIKAGTEEYKLVTENRLDNGKRAPFTLWVGFIIYNKDVAIGAVQTAPKRNVWLLPSLPEDQKLKLAAACLSLIVVEQQRWLLE